MCTALYLGSSYFEFEIVFVKSMLLIDRPIFLLDLKTNILALDETNAY